MVFFVKMSFLKKNRQANTICVRTVKKNTHFRCNYLFLENVFFFLRPFHVTKHYKNRGFSRHRGKPKMALLVAKVPFWEGASKGALLSVIPESCALLKTLFYSVFSKTQLCRHKRVQLENKKQKFNKNRVWWARMQKGVFCHFLVLVVLICFSLCFCAFVLYKIAQNGYFPAFLGFLSILFPQKACLKLFLFFLFCFFAFVFPFKNPLFSLFFVHQPLFRKDSLWGFFCFSFVCLFLS